MELVEVLRQLLSRWINRLSCCSQLVNSAGWCNFGVAGARHGTKEQMASADWELTQTADTIESAYKRIYG